MSPLKLSRNAARECVQMIVWIMAEKEWSPDTLNDIMAVLEEYDVAENPDDHEVVEEDWPRMAGSDLDVA